MEVRLAEAQAAEIVRVVVPPAEVRLVEAVQAVHRIHNTQKPLRFGGAFFI